MNNREAIHHLNETHCESCEIKKQINKKFSMYVTEKFCLKLCPVGEGLANIGQELEYGSPIRVGEGFNQEEYEKLSKKHTDRKICELVGISVNTLCRRKKKWGVTNYNPLAEFTVDEYNDLKLMRYSDLEVAEIKGVTIRRLRDWKAKKSVRAPSILTELLITKTKNDYFELALRGLDEKAIAEKWNISTRTLRKWRKEKGVRL